MRLHIAAAALLSASLARAEFQDSGLEFINFPFGNEAVIRVDLQNPSTFSQSFEWASSHNSYNPTSTKLYINGSKVASSERNDDDSSLGYSVTLNPTSNKSQSGRVQVKLDLPGVGSISNPNFKFASIMFLELISSELINSKFATTYTRAFTFTTVRGPNVPEAEEKYFTNTAALFPDNSGPFDNNIPDFSVLLNSTNTQDNNTSPAVASDAAFPTKSPLSAGAIAGIVVGCAVAVILMTVLAWWLLRRRRRGAQGLISYDHHGSHTQDLMASKGVTTGIEISPHSPYSDDGTSAATSLPVAAATAVIPSNNTHHSAYVPPPPHPLQPLHPHAHATGHDARYIMAPIFTAAAVGGGGALATTTLAPAAPQSSMLSPVGESAPPYSRFPNPSAAISVSPSEPQSSHGTAASDVASAYAEGVAAPPPALTSDAAVADTDRPDGLVVSRSSTPCSVPSHYRHLIQDGMTPEQVRTLMDEERIIDEAIQQSERRS